MFVACHPMLSVPARVALTLRLLGGLTTTEIARAYLVPEATIAQRIVRAKKTIAECERAVRGAGGRGTGRAAGFGARGDLPDLQRGLLGHRRRPVAATGSLHGGAAARSAAGRARARRGRGARAPGPHRDPVLAQRGSRRPGRRAGPPARSGPADVGPSADQPRTVVAGAGARARDVPGPYTLQAAIAACHARAFRAEDTDWNQMVALYEQLASTMPSPIVELNRAVALSMSEARPRRSTSSISCVTRSSSTGTTCSTASGATCCHSWTGTRRLTPSSNWRRRWPGTTRNGVSAETAPTRWRAGHGSDAQRRLEGPGPLANDRDVPGSRRS